MNPLLSMPTSADNLVPHDLAEARIATADWRTVADNLGHDGFAVLSSPLTSTQCDEVAGYFFEKKRFRSRIVMERYAFGRGEYK